MIDNQAIWHLLNLTAQIANRVGELETVEQSYKMAASATPPSLEVRSFASVLAGMKVKVKPPQVAANDSRKAEQSSHHPGDKPDGGPGEFEFDEVFASSTPKGEREAAEGLQRAGSSLGTVEEEARQESDEEDLCERKGHNHPSVILSSRPGSPPHLITRQHSLRGPSAVAAEHSQPGDPSPHAAQTGTLVWQQVEMVIRKEGEIMSEVDGAARPSPPSVPDLQAAEAVAPPEKEGDSLPSAESQSSALGLDCQPVELLLKPLPTIYSDSSGDEGASASESVPSESLSGSRNEKLSPSDFELLRVVGQGAFGKVFQVG